MTGGFEILTLDLEKKRIGVALVLEGAPRGAGAGAPSPDEDVRDYQARADAESSGGSVRSPTSSAAPSNPGGNDRLRRAPLGSDLALTHFARVAPQGGATSCEMSSCKM